MQARRVACGGGSAQARGAGDTACCSPAWLLLQHARSLRCCCAPRARCRWWWRRQRGCCTSTRWRSSTLLPGPSARWEASGRCWAAADADDALPADGGGGVHACSAARIRQRLSMSSSTVGVCVCLELQTRLPRVRVAATGPRSSRAKCGPPRTSQQSPVVPRVSQNNFSMLRQQLRARGACGSRAAAPGRRRLAVFAGERRSANRTKWTRQDAAAAGQQQQPASPLVAGEQQQQVSALPQSAADIHELVRACWLGDDGNRRYARNAPTRTHASSVAHMRTPHARPPCRCGRAPPTCSRCLRPSTRALPPT